MTAPTTPPKLSLPQALEQARAKRAWELVDKRVIKIRDTDPKQARKYAQLAQSAPTLIQTNGLGQAMAFWKSKSKSEQEKERPHGDLLNDLSDWLRRQLNIPAEQKDVLIYLLQSDNVTRYRRATLETLAFLRWLKRFAEAEMPEAKP